jgi:hypothetical protein
VDDASVGRRALTKVTWRLIPFVFVLYIVAFLDGVNVGFEGSYVVGYLSDTTGSTYAGMLFLAVLILLSGILAVAAVRHEPALEEVERVIDPVSSTST